MDVGVAPVGDGSAKVTYRALGDGVGNLRDEGELVVFDGVEFFIEVLPRWPEQSVGAAELVGGEAEVENEPGYADGAAAVVGLLDGEG